MNINYIEECYPTPKELLDKIFVGINWNMVHSILEPSAGKGNIVDYIVEKKAKNNYISVDRYKSEYCDIDCIEIDEDLRKILKGKGYRVVHDNFLTYNSFKHYDLIVMNPPFSNGDKHLLKALDMQKNGGNIICILNAETIKNPYSKIRKDLKNRLNDYDAHIEFLEEQFSDSERKTNVEIAIVKIMIPEKEYHSKIFESLRYKKWVEEVHDIENNSLSVNDFVKSIVNQYNMEIEAGIKLIREYKAMLPMLQSEINKDNRYSHPLLELKVGGVDEISINKYLEYVRKKYWSALFNHPKFTGNMTNNLRSSYQKKVNKLINYDFSYYNIKSIQIEMTQQLITGIEDCIIELFDKLSYQYAYSNELSRNIHYYNGWKTNKAWIINKRVILPFVNAWGWFGYDPSDYTIIEKLSDIEKSLNYLDGGLTDSVDLVKALNDAKESQVTKKIPLKYFNVTFYKKGTCHIEFTNLELLKKLNIFGSQKKGWLPPSYGKKKYTEMEQEEKNIIDEFEGEKEYEEVMKNTEYYVYDAGNSMKMLEMGN